MMSALMRLLAALLLLKKAALAAEREAVEAKKGRRSAEDTIVEWG